MVNVGIVMQYISIPMWYVILSGLLKKDDIQPKMEFSHLQEKYRHIT
jgi:hypothetical protein